MNLRPAGADPVSIMRRDNDVSPYLKRPLRSLEDVLRQRSERLRGPQRPAAAPAAGNSNLPPQNFPPAKSA